MKTSRDTRRDSPPGARACRPSRSPATPTPASPRLLNRLTGAGVLVENALFATLDPTVRRTETEDGRLYTLADTVGFVRQPAAPARRGVPLDARGGRRRPTSSCTSSTASTPTPRARSPPCASVLAEVGGAQRARRSSSSTRPTSPTPRCVDRLRRHERHSHRRSRRAPARASTSSASSSPRELPRPDVEVDVLVPYDRGDLIRASTRRARSSRASTSPTGPGCAPRSRPSSRPTSRHTPWSPADLASLESRNRRAPPGGPFGMSGAGCRCRW